MNYWILLRKVKLKKKWEEYENRMKMMEEIVDNLKVGWNENAEKIKKLIRIVENIRKRNMESKINNGDEHINTNNVKKGFNEEIRDLIDDIEVDDINDRLKVIEDDLKLIKENKGNNLFNKNIKLN